MTGIDDLIICPRCLKPMGEEVDTMVCQYCGYNEKEELVTGDYGMSEKRFDIDDSDMVIDDLLTGKSYIFDSEGDCDACYDLLNELNDENKLFKAEIEQLAEENKEFKKRLSYAEKVNMGLIDENHRLRLTLIHSSDLNFDINWLKENLKDWDNE